MNSFSPSELSQFSKLIWPRIPLFPLWFQITVLTSSGSIRVNLCGCVSSVAQSCPTLCNLMNCSLPGSSIYGIFLAKIWEWVAISSSRGSSWPRDQTPVSCVTCTGRQVLYHWTTTLKSTTFQLKKKYTLIYCLLFCSYTVTHHLPNFQIIPPGEGNDNPLQYSSLETSMGRGAWGATIHGIAKSWIWLSN